MHILHAAREEPDLLPPLLEGIEPSEVSYSAGNGDTALIVLSAKHDRPDLVRALHAAGAELDAINHEEMTALMSAAWNGHRGNVLELLVLGADLGDHGAEHGYRAADWAREKGHHEIAELINDLGGGARGAPRLRDHARRPAGPRDAAPPDPRGGAPRARGARHHRRRRLLRAPRHLELARALGEPVAPQKLRARPRPLRAVRGAAARGDRRGGAVLVVPARAAEREPGEAALALQPRRPAPLRRRRAVARAQPRRRRAGALSLSRRRGGRGTTLRRSRAARERGLPSHGYYYNGIRNTKVRSQCRRGPPSPGHLVEREAVVVAAAAADRGIIAARLTGLGAGGEARRAISSIFCSPSQLPRRPSSRAHAW